MNVTLRLVISLAVIASAAAAFETPTTKFDLTPIRPFKLSEARLTAEQSGFSSRRMKCYAFVTNVGRLLGAFNKAPKEDPTFAENSVQLLSQLKEYMIKATVSPKLKVDLFSYLDNCLEQIRGIDWEIDETLPESQWDFDALAKPFLSSALKRFTEKSATGQCLEFAERVFHHVGMHFNQNHELNKLKLEFYYQARKYYKNKQSPGSVVNKSVFDFAKTCVGKMNELVEFERKQLLESRLIAQIPVV